MSRIGSTLARATALYALLCGASAGIAAELAPINPYLADSNRSSLHGSPDVQKVSRIAGPSGPGPTLAPGELRWVPLGPYEASALAYSSPYADGRRTLITGSIDKLVKLDADTLRVISTYAVRSGPYVGAEQAPAIIDRFDALVAGGDRQALYDEVYKYFVPVMSDDHLMNIYGILTRENERLFFFKDPASGKRFLQMYGDAVQGDRESPLALRRQWELPLLFGREFIPFAANMSYDGWIIVLGKSGTLLAVSRDLKRHFAIDLAPRSDGAENARGNMQSYVRNSFALDDAGGIYVVTRDFFGRILWTGAGFSTDESKGAWRIEYPPGTRGSGTTPVLMGFGDKEDHLVVVADGSDSDPHMTVFWRDAIPADWQGMPGFPRRMAGRAPVRFIGDTPVTTRLENSPPVMGYGIFSAAESPSQPVPDQGSVLKNFLAEAVAGQVSGSEAIGGVKWEWNPKTRRLAIAWQTPLKLAQTICTPAVDNLLYCIGRREGQFTMEAIDWNTGASAFHYVLGPSFRYYSYNPVSIAPNGALDLMSWMGMGLVRVFPRAH
jgi:hypothetical protein